jgi:hypothetical protein
MNEFANSDRPPDGIAISVWCGIVPPAPMGTVARICAYVALVVSASMTARKSLSPVE